PSQADLASPRGPAQRYAVEALVREESPDGRRADGPLFEPAVGDKRVDDECGRRVGMLLSNAQNELFLLVGQVACASLVLARLGSQCIQAAISECVVPA